jgi:predicted  nucleic acid-binding Zn-ribbon protein
MASKLAEKAPGWFTRLLLPEIQEMKGEMKATNTKIDGLSKEVQATNKRIDDLKDYFQQNLNIIQRLAVLEQEVRDLKKEKA